MNNMGRRQFVKNSIVLTASNLIPFYAQGDGGAGDLAELESLDWSNNIPPIFCTAYIDPSITRQKGQEYIVAKYPLALVPQDTRKQSVQWRNKIKNINPEIKLLGYQMVIEETTVPGPGHDRLREAKDAWVKYPWGGLAKVTLSKNKVRRIYDARHPDWQKTFLEACDRTLESYPYDGLFLDQCTIFRIASPFSSTYEEMLLALRLVLIELRKRHPMKLFIANSSYSFEGLNGELNENRAKALSEESGLLAVHTKPEFNLYQLYTQGLEDHQKIKLEMELAFKHKRFFGVSSSYQEVRWFDFFDDVIKKHKQRAI